ncbi:hypothetical protein GQ602_002711 [Ophiocordyceps camponoti-floridani]|uniref:Uncharacterized protein n=1 Tax=Ophiocordyceps camponoti-floridani TaxID=2030778 RepID=A0A8H4QAZ1_9HYPO|nr:hypothetical protein GQ602_002711 [Ophiocordyceps camponoti-floridani]
MGWSAHGWSVSGGIVWYSSGELRRRAPLPRARTVMMESQAMWLSGAINNLQSYKSKGKQPERHRSHRSNPDHGDHDHDHRPRAGESSHGRQKADELFRSHRRAGESSGSHHRAGESSRSNQRASEPPRSHPQAQQPPSSPQRAGESSTQNQEARAGIPIDQLSSVSAGSRCWTVSSTPTPEG